MASGLSLSLGEEFGTSSVGLLIPAPVEGGVYPCAPPTAPPAKGLLILPPAVGLNARLES